MSAPTFDVIVIGGGIVGAATARALAISGGARVLVLEAEAGLARHQTGRNSGVIHSGLYYRPGSQKARLCARGRDALYDYCAQKDIPHRRCGKLVVATETTELAALDELERRGRANGLSGIERLDTAQIHDHEPAANGVVGLWIPQTGIVDFATVTVALADEVKSNGGEVWLDSRVIGIETATNHVCVRTASREATCGLLINCAGLESDRVARLAGFDPCIRLIPFRGEYWQVTGAAADQVRGLIYPVPDPRLPFLGVHLTRTLDGRVLAGPNAVPALQRYGYARSDISFRDVFDTLAFPGSWRLAAKFWRTGVAEMRRSFDHRHFAREVTRLASDISPHCLEPVASGVRAQAVDRTGALLDDFHIVEGERMIHVLSAPSPAATAALEIGRHIASLAADRP